MLGLNNARRTLLYVALVALLLVAHASAAPCDPADSAQCCACEPSGVAEPAPPQRIFLPTVQRDMPPMSSESTPLQPVPTVTPDPPVSGDVQ
jgi:hypothetical protein